MEPRINERIRVPRVRLIGVDGEQLGIFVTADAQKIADDQGLDLVEVAPNSDPPVCRIMDYGKWKYEEAIKAKKARKHQTTIQVKEIKFRPKIDKHDYETKKKHVIRFIEAGAKVKVTIMFRGREMVHAERGLVILERLAEDLRESALIENEPKLEGRNMFMLIAPVKKDLQKIAKEEAAAAAAAAEAEAAAGAGAAEAPEAAEAPKAPVKPKTPAKAAEPETEPAEEAPAAAEEAPAEEAAKPAAKKAPAKTAAKPAAKPAAKSTAKAEPAEEATPAE